MPHMPRQYPNTTGVPPESMPRPVDQHPPIPIRREAPEEQRPPRLRLGLEKMNLRTWEPDFAQVYKAMFGKEPTIDPITQQLVLAPVASVATTFGPFGTGTPDAK